MEKYYKEFLITAEPFNVEILTSAILNFDVDGISEEVNCIRVFTKNLSIVTKDIEQSIKKFAENNLIKTFNIQENILLDKNWNKDWEKKLKPIRVTDKIIIKPSFVEYNAKSDEIIIIIDPKMSFGTGEHPTTKICLKLIGEFIESNYKVLDVGSGTAILSIAAAKFGASKVFAIDIDEWAFENGLENVKINNVENLVEVRLSTIEEIIEDNFNLIVANIQRNILMEMVNEFKSHLSYNGYLIVSGLLEFDDDIIRDYYEYNGFSFIKKLQIDEWIGLVFRKSN